MAEKIKYKTRYGENTVYPVATGTEYDTTYHVDVDKHGHKRLVADGKTNRYLKIQSFAEECKIENILARCSVDPNALNQRVGQYVDMVDAPKTLAEAQNIIIKIKQEFEGLSVDEREKFGNSVERYVASYGSDQWAEALGFTKKEAAEAAAEKTEEVTAE